MKAPILVVSLIFFSLSCFAQQKVLRVAVAASLIGPVKEISEAFEKERSINVELIPGASGTLTSQIINGAPFDIIISADEKYTQLLSEEYLVSSQPISIARGSLVIWSQTQLSNPPLDFHTNKSIKSIAIAQPGLAPYGDAAKEYLISFDVWDKLGKKIFFANNVSLINQYIPTNFSDVVITSLSSKHQLESKVSGYWYDVEDINFKLMQTAAIVKRSKMQEAASSFLVFIQSSKGQSTLLKYGYRLP